MKLIVKNFENTLKEAKKDVELDRSNLYLRGFGRDTNGNPVIKLTFPDERVFSIQIDPQSFPKTYKLRGQGLDLSKKDIEYIEDEVLDYIQNYGNNSQKKKLKVFK